MEAVLDRPATRGAKQATKQSAKQATKKTTTQPTKAKRAPHKKQAVHTKQASQTKRPAQLNIRIDADLKQRGEEGLAEAGLTPSAAVRMLYEFAAANKRTPDKIVKALSCEDEAAKAARKAEREERVRAWREGIDRIHAMIHENGWDGHSEIDNMSYEELKAQAYAEKYGIGG